jgi:hypothetical protein
LLIVPVSFARLSFHQINAIARLDRQSAMGDVLTWGALIAAAGSLVALITFWVNRGRAEGESAARVAAAEAVAADAKRIAIEAHTRLAALEASFGLYRERIAAEYVSRSVLGEVEDRIGKAIERLGERLDRIFEAPAIKS